MAFFRDSQRSRLYRWRSTAHHQTSLSWTTGISTIHLLPYSTSKLAASIFCSQLTPTEIVIRGLLQHNPDQFEIKPAGEKGRGLFTKAAIKAQSFTCECKYHKSRPHFPRRDYARQWRKSTVKVGRAVSS